LLAVEQFISMMQGESSRTIVVFHAEGESKEEGLVSYAGRLSPVIGMA
jgi:calcineurin-like phosphoesterase